MKTQRFEVIDDYPTRMEAVVYDHETGRESVWSYEQINAFQLDNEIPFRVQRTSVLNTAGVLAHLVKMARAAA